MYYLYKHTDKNGEIFYIGKGTLDLAYSYGGYLRAHAKSGRTKDWRDKAREGFTVHIIEHFEDEVLAITRELELINECDSCTNKFKKYTESRYSITKINNEVAIFRFKNLREDDGYYLLLANGDVYNIFGKKMSGTDNGRGYRSLSFSLYYDGVSMSKRYYTHRLIAEAFVDNPNGYKIVNHKDFNRANNAANNLEWSTQGENMQYSKKAGRLNKSRKKVYETDKSYKRILKIWKDCIQVAIELGCTPALVYMTARRGNKAKTAKGKYFMYEEDFILLNTTKNSTD